MVHIVSVFLSSTTNSSNNNCTAASIYTDKSECTDFVEIEVPRLSGSGGCVASDDVLHAVQASPGRIDGIDTPQSLIACGIHFCSHNRSG